MAVQWLDCERNDHRHEGAYGMHYTSTNNGQKPLIDLTVPDHRAAVDLYMSECGLDVQNEDLRKRVGQMLRYREGRAKSMHAAWDAKQRGDLDNMTYHVRAARSQHRVILRRLAQISPHIQQ